ncbi:MAG: hypothetical protein H6730_02960 [Deltaproteobacteria bacterium]|nr:hypothetical protein [Deltaproteobacteria bacterium]
MRHVPLSAATLVCVLLAGTGCDPELSRVDGALRIDVEGLPLDVDNLTFTLTQGSASTELRSTAAGGVGALLVETIPAGGVTIDVIALKGTTEVDRRTADATVVAGVESRVVVSFGAGLDGGVSDGGVTDSGVPAPYEAQVTFTVAGINQADVGGGNRLTVDFPASSAQFATYLTNARAGLGRDPESFEVLEATVTAPTLNGLTDLRDLFVSVTATFEAAAGETGVEIGTGTPTATGATLVINGTHVAGLAALETDMLANTFSVRLRGDFPSPPAPAFTAQLVFAATIRAR